MTHTRNDIAELLGTNGLSPRRAFGQNFVVDANTVRRIARLAGLGAGDFVLEIGAGLGSLTLALAETGAHVAAVEIDNGVVQVLRRVVGDLPNVEVIHCDAQSMDWSPLLAQSRNWHVVANLPYNVATPLIADLLDGAQAAHHMLVMVQKEVAERFVATVRTPAYGAISVKISYWATARIVGEVPESVFFPRPNVASALVEITRRTTPAIPGVDPQQLFKLVRTGFGQRRKMLRRVLANIVDPETFALAGVSPQARAEELDVDAWGRLCIEQQKRLACS